MGPSSPGLTCANCHVPTSNQKKCCYIIYSEIEKYKRHVVHCYVMEAIFDMTVSTISVALDFITLFVYCSKGKWTLAVLTALPVILPTTVFTNVYMSDESRGYCKLPKERRRRKLRKNDSSHSVLNTLEDKIRAGDKLGIFNLLACCSGLLHFIFHRDRRIRERGAKLARKSVRRSLKYVFGTLVLRFIAWAWYLKALVFGVRALRNPKMYMRMEQPDSHWSRELLTRLDFLQAALENAPQCIIQLYTLMTDSSENVVLGMFTLTFSFIDFIRVVTSVFWNVHKGPVSAPANCYGSLLWRFVNLSSWVFLYVARCCGVALVIGSALSPGYAPVFIVPIAICIAHCVCFTMVLRRFGQSVGKLVVTILISMIFLPELDMGNAKVIVQVYSAMTLLENTIFIIPYRGINFPGYCFSGILWFPEKDTNNTILARHNQSQAVTEKVLTLASDQNEDCLIDPVVVVLMVPFLTVVGYLARMAAQYKMLKFKEAHAEEPKADTTVEERVAIIYNKRWTKMTVKEMWSNFTNMIAYKDAGIPSHKDTLKPPDLRSSFRSSQEFIRNSCYTICADDHLSKGKSKMEENQDLKYSLLHQLSKDGRDDEGSAGLKRQHTLPRRTNHPSHVSSYTFDDPRYNFLHTLDVRFLKVETPTGVHIFETCNI